MPMRPCSTSIPRRRVTSLVDGANPKRAGPRSLHVSRWLPVALALVLAGCGSPDPPTPGIPVDDEGDELPNLEGFVVDEAIRPMEGVTVRILFSDVNATTDEEGHYSIHRPTFVAEDVLLSAVAPGYQARTQQVQVSGQRSTRMDFRLEVDQYQMPHVEVLSRTLGLGCQAWTGLMGARQGVACEAPAPESGGWKIPTGTKVWAVDTTVGLAGAVFQVNWDAETALAQDLHVTLRGPVVGCCAGGDGGSKGEVHAEATGPSPLRLELTEEAARSFSSWSSIWLEVRLPDSQDLAPLSASRDHLVDAYATLFYVDAAPPGYQLS